MSWEDSLLAMTRRILHYYSFFLAAALSLSACADVQPNNTLPVPVLLNTSYDNVRVGSELGFYCENCPPSDEGVVLVTFRGNYVRDDGITEPVNNFVVPLQYDETRGEVLWQSFGRSRIPFGDCSTGGNCATGKFVGDICVEARSLQDATVRRQGNCINKTVHIMPSIVVRKLMAYGNNWRAEDCMYPPVIVLEHFDYSLWVEAVGFQATQFHYSFSGGVSVNGDPAAQFSRAANPATGNIDILPLINFEGVPNGQFQGYIATITIQAQSADGTTVRLDYPVKVRRPIAVSSISRWERVESYPPEPAEGGGCHSASLDKHCSTFKEGQLKTESRTLSTTVTDGLSDAYNLSAQGIYGSTETLGLSQTLARALEASLQNSDSKSRAAATKLSRSIDVAISRGFALDDEVVRNYAKERDRKSIIQEISGAGSDRGTGIGAELKIPLSIPLGGGLGINPGGSLDNDLVVKQVLENMRRREDDYGEDANNQFSRGGTVNGEDRLVITASEDGTISGELSEGIVRTNSLNNSFSLANSLTRGQSFQAARTEGETTTRTSQEARQELETSSNTTSLETSHSSCVLPGYTGAWSRQMTRWMQRAPIIAYDFCGVGRPVGQMNYDRYTWAVALGQSKLSKQCNPRPIPCGMHARCFMPEECGGKYPRAVDQPECQFIERFSDDLLGQFGSDEDPRDPDEVPYFPGRSN